MRQQTTRHAKPEEAELFRKKAELSQLESDLADRELYLTSLRLKLNAFERAYLRTVDTRYAELDAIEAKIAEELARIQPTDAEAQEQRDKCVKELFHRRLSWRRA